MNLIFCFYLWKSINFQAILIFGSCVTCLSKFMFLWRLWPWKNSHIPRGEWEFYNIGQNPSSNIFMKVLLCTSVASVFIEFKNIFSSENDRTRLIFCLSVSYTCENLYFYTILDEESEFTFTFPQKSTDNIFKMASLSVKRSLII